ncbi:MAG: DNA polymerase III subunit delta' [Pseudomonadota bacterium]
MTLLPWLQPSFDGLQRAWEADRLPQGLLIHDAPGAGGRHLARGIAQLVLCTGPRPACGECSACRRVAKSEHPDLFFIGPSEDSKLGLILVDQIRELSEQLSLTSYEGRGSVAVLSPADAMNNQAANALLKTLEEPRRNAYLVLHSAHPSRLPATVLSRCQKLAVQPPDRPAALAWLQSQRQSADWPAALDVLGTAPLQAVDADPAQLRELRDDTWRTLRDAGSGRLDVVRTADQWTRQDPQLRLGCIENCLTRQILASAGAVAQSAEMGAGAHLSAPDLDINIAAAFTLLDSVRETRQQLTTALNKSLALERLLWRFHRSPAGRGQGNGI